MKTPKVVCDAAVLAEAILDPSGECGQLVRRFVEERSYEMVLSPQILEELDHLLLDEEVLRQFPNSSENMMRRYTASLGFLAIAVDGTMAVPSRGQRVQDEKYLSAALEVGGGVVVSTDDALLETRMPGLEVISPRTLVEVLDAS